MKVFIGSGASPGDAMTEAGAAALSARIAAWWARRGHAVAPEVERATVGPVALHLVRLPPMPGRPRGTGIVGGREKSE